MLTPRRLDQAHGANRSDRLGSDATAVQAHVGVLQSVIQRMATNSASVKAWCITLVSAILVISADREIRGMALVALVPILVFMLLDAYYLGLEKGFRLSYSRFISSVHTRTVNETELFELSGPPNQFKSMLRATGSFSVWPFYGVLLLATVFVATVVIAGMNPQQ